MAQIKLPRLLQGWRDQPKLLERYWDIAMKQIEDILNQLLSIPLIIDALADLDAAILAAQAAADNANNAADSVTSETSIVNSYPANPSPAPLISADSTGLITISNHQRVYGDPTLDPTVSVTGNTIATGLAPASIARVYYNDPARSGGGVAYLYTVDPADPPVQGGDTHSVGAVTIPAAGSQAGGQVNPPGHASPIP